MSAVQSRLITVTSVGLLLITALFFLNIRNKMAQPSATFSRNAQPSITLTFWTLQLREFSPLITQWIQAYEAEHPNIHIRWVDVPFSEGEKRALSAMLSPTVPDVINLNPAFASTLAQRNVLHVFHRQELTSYHPALVKLLQQKEESTYAVPWYTTTRLYFYNSHLMSEKTAKEILSGRPPSLSVRQSLKAKQAYARFPLLTQGGNTLKALQQAQPEYPNKEAVEARLRYLMSPVQRGIKEGWMPQQSITGQYGDVLELYMAGRLAILEAGSSALGQIKNNAPSVYKATRILEQTEFREDGEWIDASPMVLVVPQKSEHPEAAKAFARYITNTANQLELSKRAPILPSTTEGLNSLSHHTKTTLEEQALVASVLRIQNSAGILPVFPHQARLNDASNAVAQSLLLNQPGLYNTHFSVLAESLVKGSNQ
jgi:putative chitobiose transport system substrate-binding protein